MAEPTFFQQPAAMARLANFPNSGSRSSQDQPCQTSPSTFLRHSFASAANDLGFSQITIAALHEHATGSMTSKYVHTLGTTLIMAADAVYDYIQGLLEGQEFQQAASGLV